MELITTALAPYVFGLVVLFALLVLTTCVGPVPGRD